MKTLIRISVMTAALSLVGLLSGCWTCIGVSSIPATPSAPEITRGDVVFKAAVLPNGSMVPLVVEDYFPSGGDGVLELVVPWSESDTGPAEHAKIIFPAATFGDGPPKVKVMIGHYNKCRLEAFDKNGTMLSALEHTAGQSVIQTLLLDGGNISTIHIIGSEIFIKDLCWDP